MHSHFALVFLLYLVYNIHMSCPMEDRAMVREGRGQKECLKDD